MPTLPRDPTAERARCDDLARLRWPGGFICPRCGGRRSWRLARRPRVFGCSACGAQTSVTAGTALNRIRVPLDLVFDAAERAGRVGRTAAALSAEHGLRYGTALRLLHRLRFAAGALVPRLGIPTGWGTVSLPCTPPGWPGWLLRTRRPHRNADAVVDAHLYRDAEGRWDVRFEPRDREPRLPRVRTDRLGLRIAKVLHLYHRGVSANWLPVYVRALAAAWQRGPTRDEVLAAGSWTRVVHYVQLRAPPSGRVFRWHYPPWWYSTRENLPDRPYWD